MVWRLFNVLHSGPMSPWHCRSGVGRGKQQSTALVLQQAALHHKRVVWPAMRLARCTCYSMLKRQFC